MSEENVEIWRAGIEAFLGGTAEPDRAVMLDRVSEDWAPDIEWNASDLPLPDLAGVVKGREKTRGWWAGFLDAWETARFEYELLDAGESVVALFDQTMRGRSTGIEVALGRYAILATFRDGLITRMKVYMNQAEALKAAGLSE